MDGIKVMVSDKQETNDLPRLQPIFINKTHKL